MQHLRQPIHDEREPQSPLPASSGAVSERAHESGSGSGIPGPAGRRSWIRSSRGTAGALAVGRDAVVQTFDDDRQQARLGACGQVDAARLGRIDCELDWRSGDAAVGERSGEDRVVVAQSPTATRRRRLVVDVGRRRRRRRR